MKDNAFIGRKTAPSARELSIALGNAKPLWDKVLSVLHADCLLTEWNSYSIKRGWSLKVKRQDRTIFYMLPYAKSFGVAFVFGDKALRAVRESGLPKSVLKLLEDARKYAEGTGVRLDVESVEDIEIVKKFAAAKIAN